MDFQKKQTISHGSSSLLPSSTWLFVPFPVPLWLCSYVGLQYMGGSSGRPKLATDAQLEYYSSVVHPLHGTAKVYTSKNLPMTFLLRLERTTMHSRLFHLFQQIQDEQSPYLISLYGFRIERGPTCSPCSESSPADRTLEYWEYLNYSLGRHVRDRQRRGAPFTEHEVWHIIQAVTGATRLLGDHGLVWQVAPSQLLITPEGKLKCEWSHLQLNNQHLRYYRRLQEGREGEPDREEEGEGETETGWEDFTSPQEQWLVKEREMSSRLNLQKSNAYKFGLLLLYVLTLHAHSVPVKLPLLNDVQRQLADRYPPIILQVLQGALHPNPLMRWSLQQVRQTCLSFFNPEYQLLLSEGRREEMQEYNVQAQFRAGSSKHTHRHQHPSQQLSLLHDSRHPKEEQPAGRYRQRGSQEQGRKGLGSSLDQRMLQLREYRLRLKDR